MKSQSDRLKIMRKVFGLLGKKKPLFYRLLLFKFMDLLLMVINPFFYYIFINDVIVGGNIRKLPLAIGGYLAVFFVQTLVIKFTRKAYNTLFFRLKLEMRTDILKRYVNMGTDSYKKYNVGDLHNRIDHDVELFETFLQKHVIDYIFSIAAILLIAVILFILNPILTIVGFLRFLFLFGLCR